MLQLVSTVSFLSIALRNLNAAYFCRRNFQEPTSGASNEINKNSQDIFLPDRLAMMENFTSTLSWRLI